MSVKDGKGVLKVNVLGDIPNTKNYIKVKQVADVNVKNYINVEDVGFQNTKNSINAVLVDYEEPKDYLNVNFVGGVLSRQYTFDGIDDYIQLPTINLAVGDVVEFDINLTSLTSAFNHLIDTTNANRIYAYIGSARQLNFPTSLLSCKVDGQPVNTSEKIFEIGTQYHIEFTVLSASSLTIAGGRFNVADFYNGIIKNLKISDSNGTVKHFYPINDGWAKNPVIADAKNPQSGRTELWQTPEEFGTTVTQDVANTIMFGETLPYSLKAGTTYEVIYNVTTDKLVELHLAAFSSRVVMNPLDNGKTITKIVTLTEDGDRMFIRSRTEIPVTTTLNYISVKEYTHGTAINFQQISWSN